MADELGPTEGADPARPSWDTFTAVDAYGQEVSPLSPVETLLRRDPPCSVEELLDEEGLVQEFRCGSAELVERLCSPESLRTLVRYVTQEPPADAPEADRCRRPYAASELLSSGAEQLCEAFTKPEGEGLLAEFWGFLHAPEVALAVPALAGYFCSAAVALLAARPLAISAFLRRQGPVEFLQSLLGLLELRCFAELAAVLLAAETPAHLVFPTGGLARQLVDRLGDDSRAAGATGEHAAFLLDHLLVKACVGDLCYGGELLHQFAEPALVADLVDRVLQGSGAAASVLSSAVSQLHLLPSHPLLPVRSPELRMPCTPSTPPEPRVAPPQRPPAPLGDRDPDGDAPDEEGQLPDPPPPPANSDGEANSLAESAPSGPAQLSRAGAALVAELCAQLPRLCQALEAATGERVEVAITARVELARAEALHEAIALLLRGGDGDPAGDAGPLVAQLGELSNRPEAQEVRQSLERHGWSICGPGCPQSISDLQDVLADLRRAAQFTRANATAALPRSGGIAIEILCLFALLVKTGRAMVFEAMLAAAALPRCLDMLLASASSSMLHNAVRAVFAEVIGDSTHGLRLVLALLQADPLMQRVVAEQRAEAEGAPTLDNRRQSQLGYVGPLRCICADLSKLSAHSPEVANALEGIDGWADAVLPGIESAEQLYSEPLGGQHPQVESTTMPSFDCLMAMHGAMAEQSEEIDLTLEDLRDINEDLDVQQMLNRAERQMLDRADMHRRRAKAGVEAGDTPTVEETVSGQPMSEGQALAQKLDVEWV